MAESVTELAIIGSGFAGLGMAIALKRAGQHDFVLFEKDAGVGGTWRVNQYPGCACDVPSHLYSFSFELNPDWTRKYASQPEIEAYLQRCAVKHEVTPHLRLNTEVRRLNWDEARAVWRLTLSDGTEHLTRHVVSGMGGLSRPSVPDLPGLDEFKAAGGHVFHSQSWDQTYDLRGQRVAVVGTGASAIQFVPRIQPQVAHLALYQRTPPWVMSRDDREIPGWKRSIFRRVPALQLAARLGLYLWLELRTLAFTTHPRVLKWVQRVALAHLRRGVRDEALRSVLTPDYTMGCKRILISDDYYPALTQPNVEVVTVGIGRITANGVVDADGKLRPADAIILGTGFQAADPLPRGVVFGRGGRDLLDAWPHGPEAYKGTMCSGFPNLYFLMGPNTGLGHNSVVYMIESQIAYVMDALACARFDGHDVIDVRAEAQARYNEALQVRARRAVWSVGRCKSWYLHPVSGRNVTLWPGFTWAFRRQTRRFDCEAYQLDRAPALAPRAQTDEV